MCLQHRRLQKLLGNAGVVQCENAYQSCTAPKISSSKGGKRANCNATNKYRSRAAAVLVVQSSSASSGFDSQWTAAVYIYYYYYYYYPLIPVTSKGSTHNVRKYIPLGTGRPYLILVSKLPESGQYSLATCQFVRSVRLPGTGKVFANPKNFPSQCIPVVHSTEDFIEGESGHSAMRRMQKLCFGLVFARYSPPRRLKKLQEKASVVHRKA
ncbi:hypothetical protein GGX14DRAFT_399697 [Mycena pura]|uniref:Uncharacterized protein n=1 Tax=Mycena pura TaxID=153505 RepID=A0AAD6YCC9_9AGAR|nr:hypothetical protein GGX14DRAFT_399697 [Mycena pura]